MSKKYTVTPGIGVNIRKGPGTGYDKVGGYSKGTVITVLEERDGWGRTDKGMGKAVQHEPAHQLRRCYSHRPQD